VRGGEEEKEEEWRRTEENWASLWKMNEESRAAGRGGGLVGGVR
jgi:hypothetical protein